MKYELLRGGVWAISGLAGVFLFANTAAAIADLSLGLGWGYSPADLLSSVSMFAFGGFVLWVCLQMFTSFEERGAELHRNTTEPSGDLPPQGPDFLTEMLKRERERRRREGAE